MKNRVIPGVILLTLLGFTCLTDFKTKTPIASLVILFFIFLIAFKECFVLLQKGSKSQEPDFKLNLKNTLLALFLIGFPVSVIFLIRMNQKGGALVLLLLIVAQMADNGGLFIGLLFGTTKLVPKLSPGKTVEGLAGSFVVGILSSIYAGEMLISLSFLKGLIFGGVIVCLSVLGDLAVSYLKRRAGVKDSGKLLAGIGGVLDLMDSTFAAAPIAYIFFFFWF